MGWWSSTTFIFQGGEPPASRETIVRVRVTGSRGWTKIWRRHFFLDTGHLEALEFRDPKKNDVISPILFLLPWFSSSIWYPSSIKTGRSGSMAIKKTVLDARYIREPGTQHQLWRDGTVFLMLWFPVKECHCISYAKRNRISRNIQPNTSNQIPGKP